MSFPIIHFRNHPENGFLWSTAQIAGQADEYSPAVLAELFVRLYLYDDQEAREAIDNLLTDGEAEHFHDRLMAESRFSPTDLDREFWPEECSDFSRMCCEAVRLRMQLLFSADGMIPVYLDGNAEKSRGLLVPFSFVGGGSSNTARAVDLDNNEIPEWSGLLVELEIPCSVCVHYHSSEGLPSLCGRSAMLPLLMAWRRKQGELPRYSPFRVIATGEFDGKGCLIPVGTKEKLEAIQKGIPQHIFFFPQPVEEQIKTSRGDVALPTHCDKQAALEKIERYLQKNLGDQAFQLEYVLSRFTGMSSEVREQCYAHWDSLIARLENIIPGIIPHQHPKDYLRYNMILAEAYCHAGRTNEARDLNQELRQFAEGQGTEVQYECLRLQIEELVLTIDSEGFQRIGQLWQPLEAALKEFNNEDLFMRFYGTMGQVHAFWALAQVEGFTKEQSRECFKKACDYAGKSNSPRELSQDMNYLCLWEALFDDGNDLSRKNEYRQAHAVLNQIDDVSEQTRTAQHLMRILALASYRHLLTTGEVLRPMDNGLPEVLAAEDTFYCGALTHKYIAALDAAEGNTPGAMKHFRKALDRLLPESTCYGVLAVLRLTILAEGFRATGNPDFQKEGLEFAETNDFLKASPSAKKFVAFLREEAEFPGLEFWY